MQNQVTMPQKRMPKESGRREARKVKPDVFSLFEKVLLLTPIPASSSPPIKPTKVAAGALVHNDAMDMQNTTTANMASVQKTQKKLGDELEYRATCQLQPWLSNPVIAHALELNVIVLAKH